MLTDHEESLRLDALVARRVGWQLDELHVFVEDGTVVLEGHARSGDARAMAAEAAAELTGLPVENRIALG